MISTCFDWLFLLSYGPTTLCSSLRTNTARTMCPDLSDFFSSGGITVRVLGKRPHEPNRRNSAVLGVQLLRRSAAERAEVECN